MYYVESEKKLKVIKKVDAFVAGSGPAGVSAAINCARQGCCVIIAEQLATIGGISTAGLMSHFTGNVNSPTYKEILHRSAIKNEGEFKDVITQIIDPEKLKSVYLEMLLENNSQIFLNTFVSDVIKENNKVKGVIIENKSGRSAIMCDVVIDATGDGDLAAKAGVDFYIGRENDGKMQPGTLMFKVGGVDIENAVFLGSFESKFQTEKGEIQELAKKHITPPAGHVLLYKSTLPGIVTCNMTNYIGVDGTDSVSLTKSYIQCEKQIDEIIRFLREFVPGYEKCFLIQSASLMGIRETRHFDGLYRITEDDINDARVFSDWVVKDAYFNFDVHNITGSGLDKTGVQHKFKQKKGYTIPYRCLVPKYIDGLLLAGRDISGTHMAHSNFRAMPICIGMGEAAGIAASIAVKNNIEVRAVNAKDIQNQIELKGYLS